MDIAFLLATELVVAAPPAAAPAASSSLAVVRDATNDNDNNNHGLRLLASIRQFERRWHRALSSPSSGAGALSAAPPHRGIVFLFSHDGKQDDPILRRAHARRVAAAWRLAKRKKPAQQHQEQQQHPMRLMTIIQ